jgi:hypothetical protein
VTTPFIHGVAHWSSPCYALEGAAATYDLLDERGTARVALGRGVLRGGHRRAGRIDYLPGIYNRLYEIATDEVTNVS